MFENLSIFENFSMIEKIFMLVLKSGKGSGNAATFPAVARMSLRGRRFRDLSRWSCSLLLPKIFINKLPRLASVPLTEVVLQTLSIQSRDFEEIFFISSRRRALAFSATCLTQV